MLMYLSIFTYQFFYIIGLDSIARAEEWTLLLLVTYLSSSHLCLFLQVFVPKFSCGKHYGAILTTTQQYGFSPPKKSADKRPPKRQKHKDSNLGFSHAGYKSTLYFAPALLLQRFWVTSLFNVAILSLLFFPFFSVRPGSQSFWIPSFQ